jgi:hypothetical protein
MLIKIDSLCISRNNLYEISRNFPLFREIKYNEISRNFAKFREIKITFVVVVARRVEGNTKKILSNSILRPSILRLFFGSVSQKCKGTRKYTIATYFIGVDGPSFFFVSSFYVPCFPPPHTHKATKHCVYCTSKNKLKWKLTLLWSLLPYLSYN